MLSACQGSNEPPLKGKREHIFSDRDQGQAPKKRVIPPVSKTKPSQAGAWPMPFVNTTNHIPALRQTPVSDHWEKGWTFSSGSWNNSYVLMPPIVAWGRVFFVSAGQVFCLEEATGKKVWSYKVVEEKTSVFLGGGCALWKDRLYVTSPEGGCFCFEAATGKLLWQQKTGILLRAAPVVSGGRVFLLTTKNQLDVLDAVTGYPLWTHHGVPEDLQFLGASLPAVSGDKVVVCYSSGEIYQLNVKTGRVVWTYVMSPDMQITELSKMSDIVASPVIQGGMVYIASSFQKTMALDMTTGSVVWERPVGGLQTPVILGQDLFLIEKDTLLRLDRRTGETLWLTKLTDRHQKADKPIPSRLWFGPVLLNDALYVLSDRGDIRLYRPHKGQAKEGGLSLSCDCAVLPVVGASSLLVLSKEGTLYSLVPTLKG